MRTRTTAMALLAALLAGGCGPQFDPASKVQSLRVFAVQKSEPYGKPGDIEHLTMLWDDPREDSGPAEVAWFSGCNNPEGDLYYNCYKELTPGGAGGSGGAGGTSGAGGTAGAGGCDQTVAQGVGNSFCFKIPDDIIKTHTPSKDPTQEPYGLSYVFFAVCNGNLGLAPSGQQFPAACFDRKTGEQLGPDDFVAGYTAIYTYDKYTNENPRITGVSFNGTKLTQVNQGGPCIDPAPGDPKPGEELDCDSPAPKPTIACDSSETAVPCIPACPGDGDSSCPEYTIKPVIPQDKPPEQDLVSGLNEQMWIRYYADGGKLRSQVRLLSDATTGWNSDYGTTFRAPKKKGPMHIWAVAQDNRGGASWVRVTIVVQ